jgi:BlaI family penicillinase repressor
VTSRNKHSARSLTSLQQAVLDVLWSHPGATAEDVREALRPAHPLKDSSVRTLLRRLEARGYVTHQAVGKVFAYRAAVRPHGMAARAVRHVIDKFCAGSVEQFLIGMVDEQVLSADEIRRLAKTIRRHK